MSEPTEAERLKAAQKAKEVAKKVTHTSYRILRHNGHEMFVALIPLLVDFHLVVVLISLGSIMVLYVMEDHRNNKGDDQ